MKSLNINTLIETNSVLLYSLKVKHQLAISNILWLVNTQQYTPLPSGSTQLDKG